MDVCRLLKLPRSSYYAWSRQVETVSATRRRRLELAVAEAFTASRGTYGCRRICAQLNRNGTPWAVGTVAAAMRRLELKACQPRAFKRTTVADGQAVRPPERLGGEFTADRPGERLVGDITYLRTGEGWLYLAVPGDGDRPGDPDGHRVAARRAHAHLAGC